MQEEKDRIIFGPGVTVGAAYAETVHMACSKSNNMIIEDIELPPELPEQDIELPKKDITIIFGPGVTIGAAYARNVYMS